MRKQNPRMSSNEINIEDCMVTSWREMITELMYYTTRFTSKACMENICSLFSTLLYELFPLVGTQNTKRKKYQAYLLAYMLHTRDIIKGKGETRIFYELVNTWLEYVDSLEPVLDTEFATVGSLKRIIQQVMESVVVTSDNYGSKFGASYGSWKDIKYCMEAMRDKFGIERARTFDLWNHLIFISTVQMRRDVAELKKKSNATRLSLWGKWAPRERSRRFGWLAPYFAKKYACNQHSNIKVQLKAYRHANAALNKALNTVQVKQCAGEWKHIDFDKDVTIATRFKDRRAFSYCNELGVIRGDDKDRLMCKKAFDEFMEKKTQLKKDNTQKHNVSSESLACNILPNKMVAAARSFLNTTPNAQNEAAINLQWASTSAPSGVFKHCIPLIDISTSMYDGESPALDAAIGLGLRIAEGSAFGRRVMTFSSEPEWIDLTGKVKLTDMVKTIMSSSSTGLMKNITAGAEVIAEACRERDLSPNEVLSLTLVILSDMDIPGETADIHASLADVFSNAGMSTTHKSPYPTPHIVYWNLNSMRVKPPPMPILNTTANISIMSGYSPNVFKNICKRGLSELNNCTAWASIKLQLDSDRYDWIKDCCETIYELPNALKKEKNQENISSWLW